MIKWLMLATVAFVGTILLLAIVIFYEPPAFIGYIFGFFNGAALVGLMTLRAIRSKPND